MAVFHSGVAIPLWAVAFLAVALSAPPRVMSSLMALLGIAVIGSTMPPIVRWLRRSRPRVDMLPAVDHDPPPARIIMTAGTRTRTVDEATDAHISDTDDRADLVRLDDDGGRQNDAAGTTDGRLTDRRRGSQDTGRLKSW